MSINPSIGKVGSIVFFLLLFSLAQPDEDGYNTFRKCHSNCMNGILHAIGMPLAVSGVFLFVRAASACSTFTRHVQVCVTTFYLYLYLKFERDPMSPWIFYIVYMSIFEFVLYQRIYQNTKLCRKDYTLMGVFLVGLNVGALEVIGHGVYEHHHSYVLEFFNSVFHTPLYGINSVLLSSRLIAPRDDHTCW